jgi:hypothetical protein
MIKVCIVCSVVILLLRVLGAACEACKRTHNLGTDLAVRPRRAKADLD